MKHISSQVGDRFFAVNGNRGVFPGIVMGRSEDNNQFMMARPGNQIATGHIIWSDIVPVGRRLYFELLDVFKTGFHYFPDNPGGTHANIIRRLPPQTSLDPARTGQHQYRW
jgi:hypothetical protein